MTGRNTYWSIVAAKNVVLACLGVVVGYAGADEPAVAAQGLQRLQIPVVRNSEQAPIIDGKMVAGEWDYAARLTGFVGTQAAGSRDPAVVTMARRQSTVWMLSDGQYFYFGVWSPGVPEGSAPKPAGRNGKSYADFLAADYVEVQLAGGDTGTIHRFLLDGTGQKLVEDITRAGTNAVPIGWEAFSFFDEDGWTAEMRIRVQDVLGKEFSDGDAVRFNVARGWQFPAQQTALAVDGWATGILKSGAPAVKLQSLGSPIQGEYNISVGVREYEGNVAVPKQGAYDLAAGVAAGPVKPSGSHAEVSCHIETAEGKALLEKTEKLDLSLANDVSTSIKQTLERQNQESKMNLKVIGPDGGTLYTAAFVASVSDPNEIMRYASRLKSGLISAAWKLQAGFFPYWEKAKVQVTLFKGQLKDQARTLRVTVTSDKGFGATSVVSVVTGVVEQIEIPIPKLPEGNYVAKAELLDETGNVLATKDQSYVRKVFPWEHNQLGLSRGVIKPWTPMRVEKSTVKMWGRDYDLNGDGLPAGIESQGQAQLKGAVRLEGEISGEPMNVRPARRKVSFTEKAEDRVEWTATSKLGDGLTCRIKGTAEYDGFLWLEITLDPAKPVSVDGLRVVVPYLDHEAQYMHAQSCWARRSYSGEVPGGEGLIFDSLLGKGGGSAFKNPSNNLAWVQDEYRQPGGFMPHIWIGNLKRGLSWFADSQEGWSTDNAKAAIDIRRGKGELDLVLNVINKPCLISKPRTIRMGLMATPVKPLLPWKHVRTRAVNWIDTGKERNGPVIVFQDHMYAPYPLNFDYALADAKLKELTGTNYDGTRLYFNKHELGAVMPERGSFDFEWGGLDPARPYPGSVERFGHEKGQTVARALTDSRIDMLVYYIAEMAKKTSMIGTYWDLTGIQLAEPGAPENGTAYRDEATGEWRRTFDILKSRQLWKRVATMWQEIRGEPDLMEIHSTNHINVPGYSFADSILNFEWGFVNEKERREDGTLKDFIDLRPLDRFAAEGVPSQFGWWVNSINHATGMATDKERRRVERSALALGGLHNHDTGPTPALGRRDQLEFIGYWATDGRIKTSKPEVKASAWRKGKTLEVVVANLSLVDEAVSVTLDLSSFGAEAIATISDVENAELPVAFGKGSFTTSVKTHDFRLLRIELE